VITVEPAVIGVASFIRSTSNCCRFHVPTLGPSRDLRKYHVSCLSITKRYTRKVSACFNPRCYSGDKICRCSDADNPRAFRP
jgi:hypothetical protein